MTSPSVGELSPEVCCTDSKTFRTLNNELRRKSMRSSAAERRSAGLGALLILLSRAATAADTADHASSPDNGRAPQRGQQLPLQDDRHHVPEAPALRSRHSGPIVWVNSSVPCSSRIRTVNTAGSMLISPKLLTPPRANNERGFSAASRGRGRPC